MRILQKMPHKIFAYPLENLLIHLVFCLTLGSKPLPKRALHVVRSRASSFKWEYTLISLRSSSSFLLLLLRLPVTSVSPFIFPSITRCRRQSLRKMWPIQFAFLLRISCRIFLFSVTLSNTSSCLAWSVQLIFLLENIFHYYVFFICKRFSLFTLSYLWLWSFAVSLSYSRFIS